MKVIERKDCSEWTHKFTCGRCESVLEAGPDDVVARYYDGSSDPREPTSSYWAYHTNCVVCKEMHRLQGTSLPKMLKLKAEAASARRT